jgi:ubiquinone/menaquinone biosynthesis C-methylase UbiE
MLANISNYFRRIKPVMPQPPDVAYNIWAKEYDSQPDNLMLQLDEELMGYFFSKLNIEGKVVIDIGCGTGRHWQKLYDQNPRQLSGFDVSIEMLKSLKKKYPAAECFQVQEGSTLPFAESSVDLILSTLTIAHLSDPGHAFAEWSRVLNAGGKVYLSDFHPQVLKMGGNRSFKIKGKSFVVKNFIHDIPHLLRYFRMFDIELVEKKEIVLTASLKHFYESQNAIEVYRKFYGMPLIYGMVLQKKL